MRRLEWFYFTFLRLYVPGQGWPHHTRARQHLCCDKPLKISAIKIILFAGLGICSFAHCSFAQIAEIKWATVSDTLRLLRTNERLWANRSGRSCIKSDHEKITQVAHDNWAIMSDSLRSIMIDERMSDLLTNIWLSRIFWYVFCRVGHPFFSTERNILAFFYVLFKRTRCSLRSFMFFIKECCVLCVLLRSL